MLLRIALLSTFAFILSGCQELRGPVWAPDGNFVAYTGYTRTANAKRLNTNLYVVDPEDEAGEAIQLAPNAAFPQWSPEGPTLYFLANRDANGYYKSIMRHKPFGMKLGEGQRETVLDVPNARLVGFQLSADGKQALLSSADDPRPGAAQSLEFLTLADLKRQKLEVGQVYSPALSPHGRTLAYASRPDAKSPPVIAVLELDVLPLQPQVVFPTADYSEPGAASYVIHFFPDSQRILFYAPGAKSVWTFRLGAKRMERHELPQGLSSPLMVSINEDGKQATLTMAGPAKGRIHYHVYKLDLARSRFSRLDGGSPELLGGHALDPLSVRRGGPERWAWLSSAGLALGVPGKARYFPKTSHQYLAASRYFLEQGEAPKALSAALKARETPPAVEDPGELDRAEARAYLAAGNGNRASESFEKAILLYPIGPDGLGFLFPPESGLPRFAGADAHALVKEMEAYAAAAPQDRLLLPLGHALTARAEGKHAEAIAHYQEAEKVCPSAEFAAGVKFLQGMTAFESGDMVAAGEHWEGAARTKNYPQAEYAAGLAAMAFALDGRQSIAQRADQALRLGLSMKGPLQSDLERLPAELRGLKAKQARLSPEVRSPDRSLRAWVEVSEYVVPQAFLKPTRVTGAGGQHSERRLAPIVITASDIQLAGLPEGTKSVFRLPYPVTDPLFGPNNDLLAFCARGEVFPLPEQFCEAYVVDFRGAVLLGNRAAIAQGDLSARTIVREIKWEAPRELRLTGSHVDVFGNETLLDRQVVLK